MSALSLLMSASVVLAASLPSVAEDDLRRTVEAAPKAVSAFIIRRATCNQPDVLNLLDRTADLLGW